MALSEKEKKEIKSRIDNRIKKERIRLSEIISSNASSENMFNMVRQFKKALQEDYEEVYRKDNSMDGYFGEKIAEINRMEMIAYKIDPNLFIREADKLEKNVLNQMNICLNKLDNNKTVDKNLDQLKTEMNELKFFIDLFKNTELMKIEIIKNKVSEVSDNITKYNEEIKHIENNFNKKSNSSEKGEIAVSGKINSLELLDKYLNNLKKSKDSIIKLYPNDSFFVECVEDAIYFMMNDLKSKYTTDDERLNSLKKIKDEFMNKFGYDIENNTIREPKNDTIVSNGVNGANGNNIDDNDVVRPNISREEFNRYMALASTIDDYVKDLEDEFPSILNNSEGEYESNSEELSVCIEKLYGLAGVASKVSKPYDEINNDFRNVRTYLKSRFNYEYKAKNKNRSRIVEAAKRIGLGIVGLAVGAGGFSWLIWTITFYYGCGLVIKPFVLPTMVSLLSLVMLNRAFSKDKGMIRMLYEKIRDKKKGYNDDEYIDTEGLINNDYPEYEEDESNRRIMRR